MRKCKTETCVSIITGRAVYCRECARERQRVRMAERYADGRFKPKAIVEDARPTTYDAMRRIADDERKARAAGLSHGMWRSFQKQKKNRQHKLKT
jgi:hypothetical protein